MCGITGYIGKSNNDECSFELLTNLVRFSEVRGDDATGYWGTENGADGRILYHKEPVKASDFVRHPVWTALSHVHSNLMIAHARGASTGVGHPLSNKNNHPFVSADFTTGLVHNGRIPDFEYDALKKKYQVRSDCDSEMFLRIFEAPESEQETQEGYDDPAEWNITTKLRAVSNIWSQITKGHMAVAIGERLDETNRRLWLFRKKFRSLWLADLREQLGQVFFCSTPEIWQAASSCSRHFRPYAKKRVKLIELPTEQVWVMRVSDHEPVLEDHMVRKFHVKIGGFSTAQYDGPQIPIREAPVSHKLITRLDENEVPRSGTAGDFCSKNSTPNANQFDGTEGDAERGSLQSLSGSLTESSGSVETALTLFEHGQFPKVFGPGVSPLRNGWDDIRKPDADPTSTELSASKVKEIEDLIKSIKHQMGELTTMFWNKQQEGSISESSIEDLKTSLEQIGMDLMATQMVLES